jgi:DNA-binding NtrC family response regulator
VRHTVATVHSDALPGGAAPLRCQLVVIEGPDMGRGAVMDRDVVTVGTDAACDLVLTDERVSRRHLEVRPAGRHFVVRDLASKNGTLYEGSLVTEARVPVGATLKVGRTFLRVHAQPTAVDVAPSQSRRFGELVAESLAMREVFAVLELAAGTDATVLLEGETGTGKELAARAIHDASARRPGPFLAVDCGALPEGLIESELFGHVRGAFTGASSTRAGAFVRARGGTIFLDELAGVPLAVQARLLRVLEERKVRPLGSDDEREVDVRVVAASRRDLAGAVAEGNFRPDLYYRLSVVRVVLPALRARREDIPAIVREVLRRRGLDAGDVRGQNLDRLTGHGWPGNVRELRNVLDRALALSPGARSFADLRIAVEPGGEAASATGPGVRSDLPFAEAKALVLGAFEQRYLRDVLARCDGNISAAARAAGVDRKHLRALLKRHGLLDARRDGDPAPEPTTDRRARAPRRDGTKPG